MKKKHKQKQKQESTQNQNRFTYAHEPLKEGPTKSWKKTWIKGQLINMGPPPKPIRPVKK